MLQTLKKYALYALLAGALYFLLSHHIIFAGKNFHLLKKTELSLEYTFFSVNNKKIESIMEIDILREDGIGDLLVEIGLISEEERIEWEDHFAAQADEDYS